MSLDATRLGTDLFQALVCLRHNAKLFRAWRGVRAGEFAVEVEEGNETDVDMAATFTAIGFAMPPAAATVTGNPGPLKAGATRDLELHAHAYLQIVSH